MYRVLIAVALAGAADVNACEGTEKLAEMRVQSPLKAHEPDSTHVVTLHANGCLHARFPHYDRRRGDAVSRLSEPQTKRIAAEIEASGVSRLDPARLRASLTSRSKSGQATWWTISDDDLIEFEFASPDGPITFAWRSLNKDALNFPDHPDLAAIGALRGLFLEMANEAHLKQHRSEISQ